LNSLLNINIKNYRPSEKSANATAPVNPPGASPVITLKQLWAALELKARYVMLSPIIFTLQDNP
jgi:hypothetical protein